ncbi:hypothetical protein AVDCRST_MAG82-2441, partial [uncultured Rubrobacteraceae bacterium]
ARTFRTPTGASWTEGIPGSFHRSDDEEGLPWRVHPEEYDGL